MSGSATDDIDVLRLHSLQREANELHRYLTSIPSAMQAYAEPYRKRLAKLEEEEEEIKQRLWAQRRPR
jgi:hypothetical protein